MKISVFKCEGFVVSTFHLCPWCEHFDFFAWKAPHQYPSPKHPPFHLCIKASGRLYFYFYFSMLQTSVEVNAVKGSCI